MQNIINTIRNCNLKCYQDRYTSSIRTRKRRISVNELLQGKPLIDDWRNQKVLFISQAPSKQAWADNKLSSLENKFFSDFLLPQVFPSLPLKEAFEMWKSTVFWMHTANCYPYIFSDGRNKGRDRLPDLKCANKYIGPIINKMKPEFIVLMGGSSTKYFAKSIRELIDSKKNYPSLEEILYWQKDNASCLLVKPKIGNTKFRAIAIPHAADFGDLSDVGKYAYEDVFRLIQEISVDMHAIR